MTVDAADPHEALSSGRPSLAPRRGCGCTLRIGRASPMAIYHFSAKVISRSNGSSAVAAAAYRSASRLQDERLGQAQDFSAKGDVIHSEVMLPDDAPERWRDREVLWNEVEAIEKRKDAQLAREVEFSIPREMSREDGVKLASDFVQREFVDRGMVADLNVHWDRAEDGSPKPHAHVMLSTREAGPEGFGRKAREWNATSELQGWRERWAEHVNTRLLELGIEAQIDHRSYRDQGVELEPQHKIGPAGMRREDRGEAAERVRWSTARSPGATARRSSPSRPSPWTPSPVSSRPSPTMTWRGSSIATATSRSSSRAP